ncbi:MAG: hypothetical protein Q7S68_02435 [Deltaproteobacteria bacterium]|nr:hypothetical protein [Deltaproteobacteria bacterium]
MRHLLFLFFLFFLFSNSAWSKECINWRNIYLQEEARQVPTSKKVVWVEPFRNDTELSNDEWLSEGLADYLIRSLYMDPVLEPVHYRLAPYLSEKQKAVYRISGLFQHTKNWLRIFYQIKTPEGELISQFKIETPFPLHKQFFVGTRQAAENVHQILRGKKTVSIPAEEIQNETDKIEAIANYVRGKTALESYEPGKTDVALIWFQEARKEDPNFYLLYLGMADAYGLRSLVQKQRGQAYQGEFALIENVMLEAKHRKLKKKPKELTNNRFLEAQVHFELGQRALGKQNPLKAEREFLKAYRLVPEDPLTAYYLSVAYDTLGKKKLAEDYRQRVKEMNPCFEKN